jgi:hypothetical protein
MVEIFQCRDNIIYPHIKFWWYRTMLNCCGIVVDILKMATGRNCSMSGINSGHHYLPTYQILHIFFCLALEEQFCVFKIFAMAAKTRHKKWAVKIQHCPISSKFDMWVDKTTLSIFTQNSDNHFCCLISSNVLFIQPLAFCRNWEQRR